MIGVGLNVGNLPVRQVYVGSTPVTAVYVGAEKIWPTREVVQITLGTGFQARDQFRAALSARGLDYRTVAEIPFDIELVGTGSVQYMFLDCSSLTSVPDMDTSQVTSMRAMFSSCSSLTYVPEMDTSQVTNMLYMFLSCSALTDGNVRLIGRHPNADTTGMIIGSGLTREPFYDTAGNPI